MHNFVDDNILSAWIERVSKVIDILGSEATLLSIALQKTK